MAAGEKCREVAVVERVCFFRRMQGFSASLAAMVERAPMAKDGLAMAYALNTLGTIAAVTPLLGLLGTVIGMIEMFLDILTAGVGDANRLAGGIGQALISTAAGLCVAIPAVMFHRYLRGRVTGYVVDMEKQATALLDALDEGSAPPPAKAPRAKRSEA